MLRDLTIQNYRAFKDFSIDGLARVNLIVGKNNSGKTSFLEAVYLLVNEEYPFSLLELLDNRGEFARSPDSQGAVDYQTAYIFHGLQGATVRSRSSHLINITSQQERSLSLQMQIGPKEFPYTHPGAGLFLNFAYNADIINAVQALNIHDDRSVAAQERLNGRRKGVAGPYRFVSADCLDFEHLAALWDDITLAPSKEQDIADALQILEPSVEDVRLASSQTAGRILVKLKGQRDRIPLSSMGEGMRRMLMLAASVVTAEDGVVLIDEIDTGLYYGAQPDMWRLILTVAQRLNVQIFATTHSGDCVAALQEALEESPEADGRLFRLEEHGGDIRAILYEEDELATAVRHAIEVR